MLTKDRPGRAVRCALFVGVALSAALLFGAPTTQAASGPADAQATEMVRLINGVRSANGLAGLNVDPNLAGLARDKPISCPDDASQVMLGRAKDFAAYVSPSHYLRLCPSVLFVSVLQSVYGYGTNGEIVLNNLNYGTGARLLTYKRSRHTWQTWTYYTNQAGILGWMNSSTHRVIILGHYDRVGCGVWIGADGTYYYDCLFSLGGPGGTVAPPTTAPFANPIPTARPTPKPTAKPTAEPTPARTPVPTAPPTEAPSETASGATPASVLGSPTAEPSPIQTPRSDADPTGQAAKPAGTLGDAGVGGNPGSGSPSESGIFGVAAWSVLGLLAGSYALLAAVRIRRRRGKDAG